MYLRRLSPKCDSMESVSMQNFSYSKIPIVVSTVSLKYWGCCLLNLALHCVHIPTVLWYGLVYFHGYFFNKTFLWIEFNSLFVNINWHHMHTYSYLFFNCFKALFLECVILFWVLNFCTQSWLKRYLFIYAWLLYCWSLI